MSLADSAWSRSERRPPRSKGRLDPRRRRAGDLGGPVRDSGRTDFLDDGMVVIADIGDALFGSADLVMGRRTEFISPAYYTSMGFGVPAARRRGGWRARELRGRS